MSVYTVVSRDQISAVLATYGLGELLEHQGIVGGVTNTNYHLQTTAGEFALTLFEQQHAVELEGYFALLAHLAARQFPCAAPCPSTQGGFLTVVADKPAAIFPWFAGELITTVQSCHLDAIGTALAQLHLAASDFSAPLENVRGTAWMTQTAAQLMPALTSEQQALLALAMDQQARWQDRFTTLPQGIIHADLFRDNVLFEGEALAVVLDFYYACRDTWLLDLATVIQDWCCDAADRIESRKLQRLLAAYTAVRPLTSEEQEALPAMCQRAALRYWLSRLLDFQQRERHAEVQIKDPEVYERKLRAGVQG